MPWALIKGNKRMTNAARTAQWVQLCFKNRERQLVFKTKDRKQRLASSQIIWESVYQRITEKKPGNICHCLLATNSSQGRAACYPKLMKVFSVCVTALQTVADESKTFMGSVSYFATYSFPQIKLKIVERDGCLWLRKGSLALTKRTSS